jgi:hypothetical protein
MDSNMPAPISNVPSPDGGAEESSSTAETRAVSFKADIAGTTPTSDAALNQAIRDHAGGAEDWQYSCLYRELTSWATRFNQTFFDGALPPAAISLDRDNINSLGSYQFRRDGLALNYRININTKHLADQPHAEILDTLCHEQIHQWEHLSGRIKGGRYHSVAFRRKAETIGLRVDRFGRSLGLIADGPFARLLAAHNIQLHIPPTPVPQVLPKHPRSSISPWACSCTRVWVARHTTLVATCEKCGGSFVRATPRAAAGW